MKLRSDPAARSAYTTRIVLCVHERTGYHYVMGSPVSTVTGRSNTSDVALLLTRQRAPTTLMQQLLQTKCPWREWTVTELPEEYKTVRTAYCEIAKLVSRLEDAGVPVINNIPVPIPADDVPNVYRLN